MERKKYSNLSEHDQTQLQADYYDSKLPLYKIFKNYGLASVSEWELITQFPPVVDEKTFCEFCGKPVIAYQPSRRRLEILPEDYFCPECGHRPYIKPLCGCKSCMRALDEARRKAELEKRERIRAVHYAEPVDIDQVSFKNRVLIAALCHVAYDTKSNCILPNYEETGREFGPMIDMLGVVVEQLYYEHILLIDPNQSDLSAFKTENFPNEFVTLDVAYRLNVTANGEYISVNEFMHPTMLRRDDIPAAMAVWKDISVDECIEFLCWRVKKLGWHLKSIERARDVFFCLLEYFSVSQIFRIITKSAEYTARIALEQDVKGYEAANMLVQCCKSRGQTTIRNEWDCYCYSRPMELPQSELSYHLAYRVLGVDEAAFTSNYSQLLEKLLTLTDEKTAAKNDE